MAFRKEFRRLSVPPRSTSKPVWSNYVPNKKVGVYKRGTEKKDQSQLDLQMSPSYSSFEVLDPHDPVISRLATQLFKKTSDYLQGEMTAGQEYYSLLENINRLTITKYADVRNLAVNLDKTLNEYNEMYVQHIQPLLDQIDAIDAQVSLFEVSAYRLDNYTKQLKARFKELEEK